MGQICPDKLSEIYQYMRIGDKAKELSLICQPKKKTKKKKPLKHQKELSERGRKRPLMLNGKYGPHGFTSVRLRSLGHATNRTVNIWSATWKKTINTKQRCLRSSRCKIKSV